MLIQLPEEKKNLIIPLFKKPQPNRSALGCYFNGTLTGKAFVDDLNAPTKAICQMDMSWVYISDDADLLWIEETLGEIIKTAWIQVVWAPERKGKTVTDKTPPGAFSEKIFSLDRRVYHPLFGGENE